MVSHTIPNKQQSSIVQIDAFIIVVIVGFSSIDNNARIQKLITQFVTTVMTAVLLWRAMTLIVSASKMRAILQKMLLCIWLTFVRESNILTLIPGQIIRHLITIIQDIRTNIKAPNRQGIAHSFLLVFTFITPFYCAKTTVIIISLKRK